LGGIPVVKHPKHPDWDEEPTPHRDPLAKVEGEPEPKTVRIRCTSHGTPFTEKKALAFGEEADVSEEVAKALVDRELAEYVKGEK
jgi:hypothetical protein